MASAARLLLPLSLLLVLSLAHGYHFVGCYRDSRSRDLPVRVASGSMSIGKCNHLCTSRRYKFFGLQASNECWCGNSYGRYGAKPYSDCKDRCSGQKAERCGAGWRNSVYTTDYVSGLHYVGCFVDNGHRDLPVQGGRGGMTVHKCNHQCRSRGYAYFGVQYADECYCGNSYGRYGARPDSECNMHCKGDGKTLCGSAWRNNVYSTGIAPKLSISSTGLRIRNNMAAKIRSMYSPIPADVFCANCLVTFFHRKRVGHSSENFPVHELNARMSRYPAKARNKLRVLQFGANAKTTFEDSKISIGANHATKTTYFGIAQRANNRIHLGMVSTDIVANLVHKYNEFHRRVCRKILFWKKCKDHLVRERRGFRGNEIRQIDTALQSETMRVFTESLGHIHV